MTDCSAVTITLPAWADPIASLMVKTEGFKRLYAADAEGVKIQLYEVSAGLDNEDVAELLGFLQDHHVPWFAHDGGHYSWDPYSSWYIDGYDNASEVPSLQDGGIVLTRDQIRRAILPASSGLATKEEALSFWFDAIDRVRNAPAPGNLAELVDRASEGVGF